MNFLQKYVKSLEAFISFIKKALHACSAEQDAGDRIGVIISPWLFTPVPWFFFSMGLMMRYCGAQPVFVWDDLPFEKSTEEKDLQNKAIEKIFHMFREHGFECHVLSQMPPASLLRDDYSEINRLAHLNAIWQHRTTIPSLELEQLTRFNSEALLAGLPRIKRFFSNVPCKAIIVEGGVYRNSGLFLYAGQQSGVRVTTYDGSSMTGINSCAGHQMDMQNILKSNYLRSETEKQIVINLAKAELSRRYPGWCDSEVYLNNDLSGNNGSIYDVVIPLNVDYDIQALDKCRFFKDPSEWLLETVHFLLEKAKATVVVRQHPGEKANHPGISRNIPLEQEIRSSFENHSHFKFISCEEPIKTYDLIAQARLVLPFTSTIGIEAAMMGKKVIMESSAYYADLSFAYQAISKDDYFRQIWSVINSEAAKIDEGDVENAMKVYYLSQICNRLKTNFTPNPKHFDSWVQSDFIDLIKNQDVQILIHSLMEGVPLAEIRNRIILTEEQNKGCSETFNDSVSIKEIIKDILIHNAGKYFNNGKSMEALEMFDRYESIFSEIPNVEYYRAIALARINKAEDAIRSLKKIRHEVEDSYTFEKLLFELESIHTSNSNSFHK